MRNILTIALVLLSLAVPVLAQDDRHDAVRDMEVKKLYDSGVKEITREHYLVRGDSSEITWKYITTFSDIGPDTVLYLELNISNWNKLNGQDTSISKYYYKKQGFLLVYSEVSHPDRYRMPGYVMIISRTGKYEYDSAGRLAASIFTDENNEMSIGKYIYSERVDSTILTVPSKSMRVSTIERNNNGKIITSRSTFTFPRKKEYLRIRMYDKKDSIIMSKEYIDNKFKNEWIYSYSNKKVVCERLDENDSQSSILTTIYDDKGRILSVVEYKKDGSLVSKRTSFYTDSENGDLLKDSTYNYDIRSDAEVDGSIVTTYRYNPPGRLIEKQVGTYQKLLYSYDGDRIKEEKEIRVVSYGSYITITSYLFK